jgi:hypothetical protein
MMNEEKLTHFAIGLKDYLEKQNEELENYQVITDAINHLYDNSTLPYFVIKLVIFTGGYVIPMILTMLGHMNPQQ